MTMIFNVICVIFVIFLNNVLSQPPEVCVISSVLGAVSDYESGRDPRVLMGTYSIVDTENIANLDEGVVDITAPIYEHQLYAVLDDSGTATTQYLFKSLDVGWILSDTLPIIGETVTTFLTCFQQNLFDCTLNKWYWGYNRYDYPINSLKVLGGACNTNMCINNLTTVDGEFDLSGYLVRESDSGYDRDIWRNQRDTDLFWYYRENEQNGKTLQNWVYGKTGSDRIACSPGYVEMPLFCKTFVYAGTTLSDYRFKLGSCDDTWAPTMEPTLEPIPAPTRDVATEPPVITCEASGDMLQLGESVTEECDHGYRGPGKTGYCIQDPDNKDSGIIGDFTNGCFPISFSDEFVDDFMDDLWFVYQTEDIPGAAAVSYDDSSDPEGSLKFYPDDPARVGIIRSMEKITYPSRVRAVVEKREDECNLWGIALGKVWEGRQATSTRLSYGCIGGTDSSRQFSLYNASFRLYDSKCWLNPEQWPSSAQLTMEVTYSLQGGTAVVTTSSSDCARLKLPINDIVITDPLNKPLSWDDAYLYLGSYNDDAFVDVTDPVVGRFRSIAYTQFYSDFDGTMEHIWNSDESTATFDYPQGREVRMGPTHRLVSNESFYQFTIPFMINVTLERPVKDTDGYSLSDQEGVYSHYISLGDSSYVNDEDDVPSDAVQIVWDQYYGVKLVFTEEKLYEIGCTTPEKCDWETNDVIDVTIIVDEEKLIVTDGICESIVAAHNLQSMQTILTLGFYDNGLRDYTDKLIAFSNLEVYQYPLSYAGSSYLGVADEAETEDVISSVVVDCSLAPGMITTPAPTRSNDSVSNPSSAARFNLNYISLPLTIFVLYFV